jgi:hypothetical protein
MSEKKEVHVESKNNNNKSYQCQATQIIISEKQEDIWSGNIKFKKCSELIIRFIDT